MLRILRVDDASTVVEGLAHSKITGTLGDRTPELSRQADTACEAFCSRGSCSGSAIWRAAD